MIQILSHPIVAMLTLLGVLVIVHEFGHYIVGRMCGIAVETFSIGFGPKIFAWKKDFTDYRLSLIPLGGFVKFYGTIPSEDVPEALVGQEYFRALPSRRALVVAAGPVANFLLAIMVYTFLVMRGIEYPPATIGEIIPNSPAEKAGILSGDKFLKINQQEIKTWLDLEKQISQNPGKSITIQLLRNDQKLQIDLTPNAVEGSDMFGKKVKVGRAGIALGRIPAILTVTEKTSLITQLGFSHGDSVTKMVAPKQMEIASYDELMKTLRDYALISPAVSLAFEVLPISTSDSVKKEPKKIEFMSDRLPKQADTRPRDYARLLGVQNSQLTVQKHQKSSPDSREDTLLLPGDIIYAWSGSVLTDVFQLREFLIANQKPNAEFQIIRNQQKLNVFVQLKPVEVQKMEGPATIYTLPIEFLGLASEPKPYLEKHLNPFSALAFACKEFANQTTGMVLTLGKLLIGQVPLKSLGGPILIAKVAGDSAKAGLQAFLMSLALISINLGIINLFPIPILDGGQLCLIAAEVLKRKPISQIAIENFQKVGFIIVFSLVMIAMYNDLSRFWKSMVQGLMSSF